MRKLMLIKHIETGSSGVKRETRVFVGSMRTGGFDVCYVRVRISVVQWGC